MLAGGPKKAKRIAETNEEKTKIRVPST